MQSMTGFGAAERDGFKVEVRSLNHRYLEISVRMPSVLMEHEIPVRNIIKGRFARGKFDVNISFADKRQMKMGVNRELAKGIYDAFSDLQKELTLPGSLTIDFFSGYRELLMAEEPEYDTDALYNALNDAVSKVEEMRRTEGDALKKEMESSLKRLTDMRNEIEGLSHGLVAHYRETLSKRIAELVSNLSIDETRLAQEVAIMAQKSDIAEELARFRSHVQQFLSALSNGDVIGRKLDFLLQEMNRETNTVASKMDDVRIINLSIEIKTEIEKLREQVQNIQ
ncbi:YicC/YloC family endoribonuclease [Dissulfurispira sp.]|uniref:YicC/YloC family endoribonuclease n=1 Tax=Dissulfurispira sp. TaxID=2817609 RepID=UPI002FDB0A42